MKTKLLFSRIQNCKNGFFTVLIIFLMTISSFGQSGGISINCDGVIFSFNGAPVEGELFNDYPYWVGGTDSFGSGTEYFLFVQEANGDDRWEVHPGGSTTIQSGPIELSIGELYFYTFEELNGILPPCDNDVEEDEPGSWNVDYRFLPCFSSDPVNPGTAFSTCTGGPITGDCDTYYVDGDFDGYGSVLDTDGEEFCSDPGLGYSLINTDCNDFEDTVYPGIPGDTNFPPADEICDGLDNDCDGAIDEDITGCIDGVIVDYCDDKQKKIVICHNGKTKCVSINAMDAHLAHGDYLGPCGGNSREGDIDISEEDPKSYDVVFWPNPSNNLFNIKMVTPNAVDKVNLKAFDINGRLIHSNIINGNEDYQFGGQLSSGVYFVRLSQANKTEVVKIIKQ